MVDIVIAVAGKVSEYLVAPIGRQLGYLFCYRSHTHELRNKVEMLVRARDDLQITMDEAMIREDEIRPIVQDWLYRVDEITGEAEELMVKDENKSYFNLKSRYQLGREAYKKVQVIVEIQEARNFLYGVARRFSRRTVTFKEYESFESRASTLNKIMDALRDDKIQRIGVWGMGGVGKTAMVKQVAEQAKQQKLFTTQVCVDVSWTRESENVEEGIAKIQQKIAEMLGFRFQGKAESTRAVELNRRLKKGKILIVLDGIWTEVNLEEVGIPSCEDDQSNCKIVLASRDQELLRRDMGVQEVFPIQHLPEVEAWQLFKMTAGNSVERDELLRPVAMEVVKECMGLPVAIVTIAKALKDESLAVWMNALNELRSGAPRNIRGVEGKPYTCLKWSYYHLKSDELKSLFLLCGSLSHGGISMDHLLKYAMGLNFFDGINSLEEARNKLVALVRDLKASSLLFDGEDHRDDFGRGASRLLFMDDADNKTVRMYDVVRDVARNIASEEPHRFLIREDDPLEDWSETHESKFIFLNCRAVHELPQRLMCPKLQFFLLQNPYLNIPTTFFEGMNQLKVLDLSEMHFTTLPSTLQSLANLLTLRLDGCELGDIAVIGELKKLQVLSMVGSSIRQLPIVMEQLTNLRLLDLNDCKALNVIPRNILSSLSRLECLFMRSSFSKWAAEEVNYGERNACLSELNNLHQLRMLEVEIPDVKLIPEEDNFFQYLTSYAIFMGDFFWSGKNYKSSRILKLKGVIGSLLSRNGIGKLLKDAEELEFRELEEVCRGPILSGSFDNLKTLDVEECYGLEFLFLVSMARGHSQLEKMDIRRCDAMQQVFRWQRGSEIEDVVMINFPNLQSLTLGDLPELMNFGCFNSDWENTSQGMSSQDNLGIRMPFFYSQVALPALEYLCIDKLDNVKTLWWNQLTEHSFPKLERLQIRSCESLELVFDTEGVSSYWSLRESGLYHQGRGFLTFQNLRSVEVISCPYLKYVFPASVAKDLRQLELLKIVSCGVEEVVANKNGDGAESMVLFPRLASLTLTDLRNVRCFYRGTLASGWPFLKKLEVKYCNNLEILASQDDSNPIAESLLLVESYPFPALEVLEIFHMERIWQGQLPMQSFDKLKEIRLSHCRNLLSVFPASVIQGLEQLEIDSSEMKEIFAEADDLETPKRFLFPKLTNLALKNLNALECFYPGKFISEWPLLTKLEICNSCDNIDILFQEIGSECNDQRFFLVEKLAFPKLEVLEITQMENLKRIWHGQLSTVESFGNLKHIKISHCINLSGVFPTSANLSLLRLETLELDSCGTEEILVKDDAIETPFAITFPNMSSLILKNLKELKCFNSRKVGLKWPSLKKLEVWNCEKIEILFQEMSLEANLDNQVQRPFFSAEKVAFPSLEEFHISNLDNVEKIWHDGAGSFGELKRLSVQSCQKLKNIIPSNMLKRLSSLQILKIVDCNSVEEVFNMEAIDIKESREILALQLRDLCLHNLKNLEYVWNKAPDGLLTYQNLNRVKVSHCPSLKIPFPGYMVRSLLQIREVDMNSCGVEEIHEDVAKVVSMFLFPEETSLTNSRLHELKCFYLGLHKLEWPKLKTLDVESYESLEKLACTLDKDVKQPIFLCDKVTFPNLEYLTLSLKLQKIQDLEVLFGALSNLKILIVENCPFLLSLFSSNLIRCLNNLKKLTVKNCDLLEEVFDLKGLDHCEMLSNLEEVCLIGLPKLGHICNNSPPQVLFFQNLKLLLVKQCNNLKHLFSPSMVLALAQLQDLNIEDCETMEGIFAVESRGSDNEALVSCFQNLKFLRVKQCPRWMNLFPYSVVLGQLQELCIEHCSKMKQIIMEDGDKDNRPPPGSSLQNLKFVCVKQCEMLMYLFSASMVLGLVQLQNLCIEDCPTMKEIVTADGRDFDNQSPQVSSFQNLKSVQVKRCGMLTYLFPSSMALGLEQLQDLSIEHCCNMKVIVREDWNTNNKPQQVSCFQNLKSVQVKQCHCLMYLFPFSLALALVQLRDLSIEHCNAMKEIIMEDKDIDDMDPKVSCFENLKSIQVRQCDNLKYLFSSSFAAALVQLQRLLIEHCSMMKEIVTAEVGVTDEIIFPQLTRVSLLKVPKLTSFYLGQNLEKIHMGKSKSAPGVLFNEKVAFPKMQLLYVSGLNNIKKIWKNELLADSFSTLKAMKVENCTELQNISTSNVLNWLPSLELLRIARCGKLQEVFDLQVVNVSEAVTDNQLSRADDLQNLKHICNKVLGRKLCIQNLKFLKVHECRSMKNFFSPYTELKGVGEIIRQEEGAEEVIDKIEFPALTSLALKSLPSLESFYPGSPTFRRVGPRDHDIRITVLFNEKVSFRSLESLEISGLDSIKKIWHNKLIENSYGKHKQDKVENCSELLSGFQPNVLKQLWSLQILKIASCGQLEEVFDLEGADHIMVNETEAQLNHLVLQDLPQLQYIWNKDTYGILTFQNLDLVEVMGCHGLKSYFPAGSLVRGLPQLEKQLIRSRGIPAVGEKDEGEGFVFSEVTFDKAPSLRKIKGKKIMKAGNDVSETSEDMPSGSLGLVFLFESGCFT